MQDTHRNCEANSTRPASPEKPLKCIAAQKCRQKHNGNKTLGLGRPCQSQNKNFLVVSNTLRAVMRILKELQKRTVMDSSIILCFPKHSPIVEDSLKRHRLSSTTDGEAMCEKKEY